MNQKFPKLIIIAIFNLLLLAEVFASTPSNYFQLRNKINDISQKEVVSLVNDFVKVSAPSRMIGKPGHDAAKKYLLETIKKMGPTGKTSVITFDPDINEAQRFYQKDFDEKIEGKYRKNSPEYQKWFRFTEYIKTFAVRFNAIKGENLVWEKAGINSKKVLVVTAHYDTISVDTQSLVVKENDNMPGANYNASGVAIALSLIKVLSQIDLNYSVQIVFLDWQGIGYLGSYQYAKELKASGKEILGVMNLEMLGQDTTYLDKTKKTGNMSVYLRNQVAEEKWVKTLIEHGQQVENKVNFEMKMNNFDQSDTFRFWDQGFVAATFSQNWEDDFNPKFYQTTLDTPETLNHSTLYGSYKFIAAAVMGTLLDITK